MSFSKVSFSKVRAVYIDDLTVSLVFILEHKPLNRFVRWDLEQLASQRRILVGILLCWYAA